MRERGDIRRTVQQLADTGATSDPVASRQRVHNLGCQDIGSETGVNLQFSLAVVMPLELVLEIPRQLLQANPEQVLHQITGESDAFVGVVVLVVRIAVSDGHL